MRAGNTYRGARKRAAKADKKIWKHIPERRIHDNAKGVITIKNWPNDPHK